MKTAGKFGIMTVLVVLTSLFSAGSAQAAETLTPEESARAIQLNAQYQEVTPAQLAAIPETDIALLQKAGVVASVSSVTTTEKLSTPQPTTGRDAQYTCYSSKTTYTGRSAAGINLYQTWTRGKWCTGASTVTSAQSVETGGQTFWLGWSYQGRSNGGAGVSGGQGRIWNQHKFQYQLGTPYPTQYTQPCTRVKGSFYGTGTGDYVCSIY